MISLQGDTDKGFALAQAAVEQAPQDDLYLQGMARFARGNAYHCAGQVVQAIESYQVALPFCQASDNKMASMLIVANLALLYLVRGKLHAAADLCLSVIEGAKQSGDLSTPALAPVQSGYGEVLYEWNELDAAQKQTEETLGLSKRGGLVSIVAYESTRLSQMQRVRGDLAQAESALNQAIGLLHHHLPVWVVPEIVSQQVALAIAQGNDTAARQALAQTGVGLENETSYSCEVIHIAYLRLLLHLGRQSPKASYLDQALGLAERLLASAEPAGRMRRVLETLILRALIYQTQGSATRAFDDLRQALVLAEPEGYIRIFVDEGESMRLMLSDLGFKIEQSVSQQHLLPYINNLLASFPASTFIKPETINHKSKILPDPLSERELEILRLIEKGYSNQEIADQLVITLNTVKKHTSNIFGKLGVASRTQAISRARELGLT